MTNDDRIETALRSAYARHAVDKLPEPRYLMPPRHASRGPSGHRGSLAVASCAVVVAGVIALVLVLHGGTPAGEGVRVAHVTPSPSAAQQTPPPGTVARLEAVGRALVTADGRTIYTSATGGGCTRTAILTATESSTEVVLDLNGYTTTDTHLTCTANLILWTRSTTLTTPLDGRRLIDGSTGRVVPYLDGHNLAAVTWLPKGASVAINSPGEGWTRSYTFPGQRDVAPIDIAQSSTNLLHSEEFQANPDVDVSHLTIHGHRAVLVTQRLDGNLVQDRLGWNEAGYTFIVDSEPEYGYQQPFSPHVIERIARGLQPAATGG
jgi:hypothetical protein